MTPPAHAPGHDAPAALRALYAQYARYVWRVVRRLGVPAADAEDVTHDVFIVVLRKLAGFRGDSSERTWLYGIALRCAADYRRRAHVRRERVTAEPDAGASAPAQVEDADRRRARALLDTFLDQLDDARRAVFVFYEIEELPMSEVAEIVGCPVQTAYSRLHAARRALDAYAGRLRRERGRPR